MPDCCPPGRGCNAPDGEETCALEVCAGAVEELEDAGAALLRWRVLVRVCHQQSSEKEKRFRRRAYERSRDRALVALALRQARRASGRPRDSPGLDRMRVSDRAA